MKMNIFRILVVLFGLSVAVTACSDISETQREFLDRGETNYVGILDGVTVRGGNGRVVVEGKKTYLRNAVKFIVKWVDNEGTESQKEFAMQDVEDGDYVKMEVSPLPEGDYTFYVYSIDEWGNSSLGVETIGTSYGEKYKSTQSPISIIRMTAGNNEGEYVVELSQLKDAVKCRIDYMDEAGRKQSLDVVDFSEDIVLNNWENKDGSKITVTSYVVPADKNGLDVVALDPLVQTVKFNFTKYTVDKSKMHWMKLTDHDDDGKAYGAAGTDAAFDNGNAEFWSGDRKAPGHFCFDMGTKAVLTDLSYVGRNGYPGWDVVKFEVWGRESIDDGPDGDTGYNIKAASDDPGFEDEALRRGWKHVGNGWLKYAKPRQNPQTSQCELTEVDKSIAPRYILFRVMSVLAPDLVPVPDDGDYYGEGGGYYLNDGVNDKNRAFAIGELTFKAEGVVYTLE